MSRVVDDGELSSGTFRTRFGLCLRRCVTFTHSARVATFLAGRLPFITLDVAGFAGQAACPHLVATNTDPLAAYHSVNVNCSMNKEETDPVHRTNADELLEGKRSNDQE